MESRSAGTSRAAERIFFSASGDNGLEGIIAKRKKSTYQPGRRSLDWLKIKSRPQQEFIACGFTEGKGSRKHFGALLFGAYCDGKLRYYEHSGSGFSERALADALDRLKPLFVARSPFVKSSEIRRTNSMD
jgi:bifunctional non-homologous end joining protein LigD